MTKKEKYQKLLKEYKKKIIDNAKATRPWDFGWMLDSIILNLEFMQKYYKIGYNVISAVKEPTRLEMCTRLLETYEKWQNVYSKYYIHHDHGGIKNGKGLIVNNKKEDWWVETLLPDVKENRKAYTKEYNEYKSLFFKLLGDYIEQLWD